MASVFLSRPHWELNLQHSKECNLQVNFINNPNNPNYQSLTKKFRNTIFPFSPPWYISSANKNDFSFLSISPYRINIWVKSPPFCTKNQSSGDAGLIYEANAIKWFKKKKKSLIYPVCYPFLFIWFLWLQIYIQGSPRVTRSYI